jgi:hypothetical protein
MKRLALFSLLIWLATARLGAQESTGTVNGTVFDAQGAAIVNAEVTITDPSTGFTRKTASGTTGNYSMPLLPPSTYTLRVQMSHHITFQASDVISWLRSWGGYPVASYGGSGLAIAPEQQFQPNEFGPTNFDERNRFVFSGVFQLP